MTGWPNTCAEVSYDMLDDDSHNERFWDSDVGDLLWNPKGGDGHVLVAEMACGSEFRGHRVNCGCLGYGLQPCPSMAIVYECGEDNSFRDHHYMLLARKPSR